MVRSVLTIVAGWLGGSLVNMGLVQLGHSIFPLQGVDTNDMEALAEVMPNLGAEYFVFPFLAHALGTLVGAIIAALIAGKDRMSFAMVIGVLFLLGGIAVNYMLPGPMWFTVLDMLVAYLPMAWLGGKIAQKIAESRA